MDCGLSCKTPSSLQSLPSSVKTIAITAFSSRPASLTVFPFRVSGNYPPLIGFGFRNHRRPLIVVASGTSNASSSPCEFSGLNTPLQLRTPAGKLLSSVLQNDCELFPAAVEEELRLLADGRDEAVARMKLSSGTDEACLHRRIAELKEEESRAAVEDVMYLLVFQKFAELRVHLVPRLSKCVYNGRLEIWPSKDWELESVHSFEVLELVKEHLFTVLGWRADSNVTDNWAIKQIHRTHLCRVYVASILYGYFLKSASLRHHLEQNLDHLNSDIGINPGSRLVLSDILSLASRNFVSRTRSTTVAPISGTPRKERENLRYYVMGFEPENLQMCAKPKSKEAMDLIERHTSALFGDEKTGLIDSDDVIITSLASLKRFALEAVAFGSFLWDAEECVETVYKLEEN